MWGARELLLVRKELYLLKRSSQFGSRQVCTKISVEVKRDDASGINFSVCSIKQKRN